MFNLIYIYIFKSAQTFHDKAITIHKSEDQGRNPVNTVFSVNMANQGSIRLITLSVLFLFPIFQWGFLLRVQRISTFTCSWTTQLSIHLILFSSKHSQIMVSISTSNLHMIPSSHYRDTANTCMMHSFSLPRVLIVSYAIHPLIVH